MKNTKMKKISTTNILTKIFKKNLTKKKKKTVAKPATKVIKKFGCNRKSSRKN
jgi:hypothetical protein